MTLRSVVRGAFYTSLIVALVLVYGAAQTYVGP